MVCFMYFHDAAQRFALPALGRAVERRPTGKMIRRRKMLENAAESPASGAHFVGRRGLTEPAFIHNTLSIMCVKSHNTYFA